MTCTNGATPLLELEAVSRIYMQGGEELEVLKGLSMTIHSGEFVAIMGQSGSGKTTLMNILGCLDRPSRGYYRVKGKDVTLLDADELSTLRREIFGFVFQRYNLLMGNNAVDNVGMPALYAGFNQEERRTRAAALLTRLGLAQRLDYYPAQLSGGQQQRVSIARALMNGGEVILADEPTGALDSKSGAEMLNLLHELHAAGHTVILITHDTGVADRAGRVITLHDGLIVSDTTAVATGKSPVDSTRAVDSKCIPPRNMAGMSFAAALGLAVRSLKDNRFRTALTLLGIIIGVASVVAMLALGNGAKAKILASIEAMGSDLITIQPMPRHTRAAGSGHLRLTDDDVQELRRIPGVLAVVGEDRGSMVSVRYKEADYQASYIGTGVDKPLVNNWALASGEFFSERDVASSAPVAVLGQTVAEQLFPAGTDPVGAYLLIQNMPFQVIGVLEAKGASITGTDQDDVVLVPVTTARLRLQGRRYVHSITIKAAPTENMTALQAAIGAMLFERHGTEDFRVLNMASVMAVASESQDTLTMLLGSIAAISLLVGGIGVMNIMLVSVIERTREIGIRMACGARQSDIMAQFITEALMVCALGGVIGVTAGFLAAFVAQSYGTAVEYSVSPAVLALSCAFVTGLVFGFAPARKAARLDPVAALASE